MRLQRYIEKKEGLEEEDASFKAMADLDDTSLLDNEFDFDGSGKFLKGPDGYALGEAVDYHDLDGNMRHDKKPVPRIIGKTTPKVEHMYDGHPSNKTRMTIMEKVQKQLAYLTKIMELDEAGQKHWYYRLKREYEKEAAVIKRLEQRQAKKAFKKMMKKHRIIPTLEQEESFDSFYSDTTIAKEAESELPRGYVDEADYRFYGSDHDFMRFHKRTKLNMHETLQDIIHSSKQTLAAGVKNMHNITINYIELNKASSLLIAYWTINTYTHAALPADALEYQAKVREAELNALIEQDRQNILTNPELRSEEEVQAALAALPTPVGKLEELNQQKQLQLEAEIQKKLTKAVPYFRGQMCQRLGLRYAPEIRFYRDNTLEQIREQQEQAREYLREVEEAKREAKANDPRVQM